MAGTRKRDLSLFVAIAISAAVHLAVLLGPAWRLPADNASVLPPLEARLTPLPRPTAVEPDEKRVVLGDAPPPKPRPRPRRPVRPAEPEAASAPTVQIAPEAQPGSGDAHTGDAAPSPGEAAADAQPADGKGEGGAGGQPGKSRGPTLSEMWAASGKVQYDVIRGERNFIIGRTTHAWTHDDERYSMETVIETAGLVGLVKPFRMIQRSEGRLGPRGLQPDKFTVERDGQLKERADFDWSSAKVVLIAGERRREFSIAEGDQDVLSLMHHLALQPEGPLRAELLVVTGKSAVRSVIENLGLEELDVPAGKVSAYHLGSTGHRGELKIDIWLARDYANLPVRLKITDKNGDVLDQVATGVDLGARAAQ
ncbi:DUF3108 domain-containing protein [Zoogloea sp.]|uniref:DUF3108 domain-containing protein n=1 Tax=Zoogloea sp. TaxID=49181 RepID=UPI00262C677B|nr:DUF3108 domain-containing protein [uncultured Zoogloea sp.]